MSKIGSAIGTINRISELAGRDQWVNRIHPLAKFLVTILYIICVVSCAKYDVPAVLGFTLYPLVMFIISDLSVRGCLSRIWIVLPFVCLIGIFNPIFDPVQIRVWGSAGSANEVIISAGWFSFLTLVLKGLLTVMAGYLLVATTTIEKICYALQCLHLPRILITEFLLIYRYLGLLLQETERVSQAYALRAPGQKGVHVKAWGSLAGMLLLRNIDRADAVYESMLLRGYDGSFRYMAAEYNEEGKSQKRYNSVLYFCCWAAAFAVLIKWPILYWMRLFVR